MSSWADDSERSAPGLPAASGKERSALLDTSHMYLMRDDLVYRKRHRRFNAAIVLLSVLNVVILFSPLPDALALFPIAFLIFVGFREHRAMIQAIDKALRDGLPRGSAGTVKYKPDVAAVSDPK